jgi:hypothetical protein
MSEVQKNMIDKVRERLLALKSGGKSNIYWKPTGKHVVRLIPLKEKEGWPFYETRGYWDINGKNFLSPSTVGKPDPIIETARELSKGDEKSKEFAKQLWPSLKVYSYVMIRGENGKPDEGPYLWGYSKGVYEDLLKFIDEAAKDDDVYIPDPDRGRDIIVEHKTPAEAGNKYGKTEVRTKTKQNKLSDDADLQAKYLNEQPNFNEIFEIPTYEQIKQDFDQWLNVMNSEEEEVTADATTGETEDVPEATKTATAPPSTKASEAAAKFKNLMNKDKDK